MAVTVACLTSTQGHHKHTMTPSVLSLWEEDLMSNWSVRRLLSGQLVTQWTLARLSYEKWTHAGYCFHSITVHWALHCVVFLNILRLSYTDYLFVLHRLFVYAQEP